VRLQTAADPRNRAAAPELSESYLSRIVNFPW